MSPSPLNFFLVNGNSGVDILFVSFYLANIYGYLKTQISIVPKLLSVPCVTRNSDFLTQIHYFSCVLELLESGNPQDSGRGRVKAPGGG